MKFFYGYGILYLKKGYITYPRENRLYMERNMLAIHPFAPVYDRNSRILILGSMPSIKSRETGFYYGHPRNRFWKVTAAVMECPVPQRVEEKKRFLLVNGIALWDVVSSCEIKNSSDSSIRNVSVNDLGVIFSCADIHTVFTNGKTADSLYRKYFGENAVCLPSTSPANAAMTLEKLIAAWRCIRF